jgi:DNA modification methylase
VDVLRNVHPLGPTVKPVELMRWLIRLVTPPGGVVLDPFLGSGSTGCAAVLERVEFIGIERDAEYLPIAEARIKWWAEHPDGMQLVKRLEHEADRKAVAESGQVSMFDLLGDA